MGLLAPLALLGLVTLPIIVAFYMLRLRRDERVVSSTYLWQQLVRDVEANTPWQRLRRSLLLLLQLILALLLVFVVARPVSEHPAGLAKDLVVVVDASASMSATDVFPTRLAAAKQAAIDALRQLPSDGKVSVIAAAETARVVANEAADVGRAARAIASIQPSIAAGDLADALKLAGALAARARGAEILVVTDDAAEAAPDVHVDAPIRVISIGRERDNQAIAALAVRADASGLKRTLFVSVANYSPQIVTRRLQILADGTPVSARDLQLDGLRRADVVIDELPQGTKVVQARLMPAGDSGGAAPAGPQDLLPLDDQAWAIVPDTGVKRILLVGPGNVYLQNALTLLPNAELYGATPDQWASTTGKEKFDLFVFDGFLPDELPNRPILAIAPPKSSALGEVAGTITNPIVGQTSPDEPLLRGVDLSRLHVAQAQRITLPTWARVVIPSGPDVPLLYSGLRSGSPTAVFAFDLRQSDLPLQVAWPILVSNLAGELLGLSATAVDPLSPDSPVELPMLPGVTALRVTLPDGTVTELAPGASGATSVTFVGTRQLGVYRVEEVKPPDASPSPSIEPSPSPTTEASTVPGASTGPGGSPSPSPFVGPPDTSGPEDTPTLFAVDLFAPNESNIAPGDGSRLVALGTKSTAATEAAGVARDEWWPPLVLLVLVVLMVEWLVYERDGARRLVNGLRGALTTLRPRRRGSRP